MAKLSGWLCHCTRSDALIVHHGGVIKLTLQKDPVKII